MADSNTYPMTRAALEELRKELEHCIKVERPALAARLKAAIAMGDLSENADYIAAKEAQGFLEGRILHLQEMIRGSVIIDETTRPNGVIALGSRIVVQEEGQDEPETFMLVGKVEADPRRGKISDESPLGRALLGKKKGDTVTISAPAGPISFKVLDVQ
ncbi:MAG: transcription elongation factor GreA [Anaerolineae bacterium]